MAHLAEVERHNLAHQSRHGSLYKYARHAYGLTDQMAYERAYAAKLALEMPEIVGKIASGELSLSAACELWRTLREAENARKAPAKRAEARNAAFVLTPELPLSAPEPVKDEPKPVKVTEKRELVDRIAGKTLNESKMVLREWKQERMGQPAAKSRHELKLKLKLELTEEQKIAWDRLRDLLSHKLGGRSPEEAFAWLLEQGLEKIDPVRIERRAEARREKKQKTQSQDDGVMASPSDEAADLDAELSLELSTAAPSARIHIPADRQRRVWIRCDSRCQYPDPATGRICGSTAFLDIDHIVTLANGGSNDESNLRLCCATTTAGGIYGRHVKRVGNSK